MRSCSLCSSEIKFFNAPLLGAGKLNDGGELCSKCYSKIGSAAGLSLKKFSLADIHAMLQKKGTDIIDKKAEAEQKKIAADNEKKITQENKTAEAHDKKTQAEEQKKLKAEQKKEELINYMQEKAEESSQKKLKLEEIKATIQNLKLDNISSFFGRKEINELPSILSPDEQINNIIQGMYNGGQGILVSTNRRLIFIDKGLLYGVKVEDFPLDKITSIQYETGLIFGKVKIHTSGNIALIDQVEKSASRKFAEFVRDKLSQPKETVVQVIQSSQQPDILEQIEKLAQLKQKGILSDEEFAEQKKKLLEKL